MKPTRIHYFIAQQWPTKIWLTAFPTAFAFWAAIACWQLLISPTRWTDPLVFLGCSLLAALLGYFVGILVGWPIMGPIYYDRSLKNGEPFHEGEFVQILVGPHRDRIVRVVEAFDHADWAGAHRIRVDMGTGPVDGTGPADGENVFRSTEIMRVSPPVQLEQNEKEPNKGINRP